MKVSTMIDNIYEKYGKDIPLSLKPVSWYEPSFKYNYERTVSRSDCMHQSCTQCHGSGIKEDGTSCIHMISCPCKACSPGTL